MNHHPRQSHNRAGTSSRTRPEEEPNLYNAYNDKENRAPGTTRCQGEEGRNRERSPHPPNDHLLDKTPPHKTQQKQSPVCAPLPDPDPQTPKLVIHDDEKLTSDYDSSSNNTSPASSSAASPEKITRFTQTDTIVNLCGQMHWLRLMYKPVVLNKE